MFSFAEFFKPTRILPCSTFKERFYTLLWVLLLGKLYDLITAIGQGILREFHLFYPHTKILQTTEIQGSSYLLAILVLYAPIYEELAFRLHLKPSVRNISISLSLTVLFVLKVLLRRVTHIDSDFEWLNILRDLAFAVVLFFLLRRSLKKTNVLEIYDKKFKLIYFLSVSLWTLLHFSNYSDGYSVSNIPSDLLNFSNLFFYGLLFSYLRMKSGVWVAICFHILTVAIKLSVWNSI